jgi:hypothetical protein
MWYWYHRFGHEVNLFWAAHVVHHQSDDYNFTVSARITIFQAIARCLFWAVLPVIGFSAEMVTILLLIHGTYPFFTHTQLIGKLGWLEYFLVTPSHHRVHHSSNPAYLDKNYGDVLIIWDKIFGTFAEEKEKPIYGLTKPLNSHSFLWQHFHFALEVFVAFRRSKTFKDKLKVVFGKPDNIDPRIRTSLERRLSFRQNHLAHSPSLINYIKFQTVLTLGVLFFVILFSSYISTGKMVLFTLLIILSVITTGSMLERRMWIFYLECFRAILSLVLLWLYYPNNSLGMVLLLFGGASMFFYKKLGDQYYRYFYT